MPRIVVALGVAFTFLLLQPNFAVMQMPVVVSDPKFVTSGAIERYIKQGDNVLVLPAGQWGPGMRWEDELDFSFDMPTGNGGGANTPEALDDPVGGALWSRDLGFDYRDELRPYLKRYEVDLVLVPATEPAWKKIVDSAGLHGRAVGGVWIYQVPLQ